MSEILGSITNVEDDKDFNGKDYKKVTLADGQVMKVKYGQGGALKKKWDLLQVGKAVKFTMGEYSGKPFVKDIEAIAELLKPAVNPNDTEIPQQEQVAVNTEKVVQQAQENQPDARTLDIHRQVAVKEIGELWRCGHITEDDTVNKKLIAWYMNWIYKTVGIDVHYK